MSRPRPWTGPTPPSGSADPAASVSLAVIPGFTGPPVVATFPVTGPVGNAPKVTPGPATQYVGVQRWSELEAMPPIPDPITETSGPELFDAMKDSDGVIASSIRTMRMQAVGATGPKLAPRYPDKLGRPIDFRDPPEDSDEDAIQSAKALEFCQWLTWNLRTPAERVSYALSGCFWWMNKVAEKVEGVSRDFDGSARIYPSDIRPKEWWQWAFVLDRFNNLDSILVADVQDRRLRMLRVPPEKFVVASYLPEGDSPIGTTVGGPCKNWWQLKGQIPKQANNYVSVFALPIVVVELGPDSKMEYQLDDNGNVDYTKPPIRPEIRAQEVWRAVRSGRGAVTPNGAKVHTVEKSESAQSFADLADLADRQNAHAITGSQRSTLPTERNSKADAGAAQDVSSITVDSIRMSTSLAWWRDVYLYYLEKNWGREWAVAYCPYVGFGEGEKRDFVALADAGAKLGQTNFITPSQRQSFNRKYLGIELPEPSQAEVDALTNPPAASSGSSAPSNQGVAGETAPS